MAIEFPEWPKGLPIGQLTDYSIQPVDPLQRVQLESGYTRVRRRYSATPDNVTISWVFTTQQAEIFEHFFAITLADGVRWFKMPILRPQGRLPHVVQFTGIYQGPSPMGPSLNRKWRYSATLQQYLRDRNRLPPKLPCGTRLTEDSAIRVLEHPLEDNE